MQWYKNNELSAGYLRLRILLLIYKLLGITILKMFVIPITFVTFCLAKTQRKASYDYFSRLYKYTGDEKYRPSWYKSFKHFLSFSFSLVERMRSWCGNFCYDELNILDNEINDVIAKNLADGKGCFILSSHLGNMELFRGVGGQRNITLNVFVDTTHTKEFNKFLQSINPTSFVNVHSSRDIGVETAILMKDKISRGEVVVMAADRQPPTNNKSIDATLLGETIHLPPGAFKFAMLMECDIYSIFICNEKRHNIHILKYERSSDRQSYIQYAHLYAKQLEKLLLIYPYQWYNFYEYWGEVENEK